MWMIVVKRQWLIHTGRNEENIAKIGGKEIADARQGSTERRKRKRGEWGRTDGG